MTTPAPDFGLPASTYRLQFHEGFTFHDAAARLDYLQGLGVTHLFCSPILQATPGSTHGYDVVDHTHLSTERGGEQAFRNLCDQAHARGMGIVVDVVPNHMAVPTPLWLNHPLWSALREGPRSPYAAWFDIDVSDSLSVIMPVLGDRIGTELAQGTIRVDERDIPSPDGSTHRQIVVVYHDHVFPVRPGTESLPLPQLLDEQWYRLAHWKVASEELNYRRFFNVDTLAAIRVEDDEVFTATHALLLDLHRSGHVDGFRIDHPDGLANPRTYLENLRAASDDAWVVVEKILEPDESLPASFACAGTTGYDSLLRVDGLFFDPTGLPPLTALQERMAEEDETISSWASCLDHAKHEITSDMLVTEITRLTGLAVSICASDIMLRDHTRRQLEHAITELLIGMNRYRAYLEPGHPAEAGQTAVVEQAAARVREHLDEDEAQTLDLVVDMACGRLGPARGPLAQAARDEFMIRFAQTCGPVMAKSKEDTAFYRFTRFTAVNEVGCDPELVGVSPDDFHDFAGFLNRSWPATMTTLSTHDTKRSTDVRARLSALLEFPLAWQETVTRLDRASADLREGLDTPTLTLLWQTLAATWRLPGTAAGARPIDAERLTAYLTKAANEAKTHTTWTDPDQDYLDRLHALARHGLEDEEVAEALDSFTDLSLEAVTAAILGRTLVQLTMPGVPDTYQGTELVDLSLVDPDNRRPVDFDLREDLLARVSSGEPAPEHLALDAAKLSVVRTALTCRRDHPDAFRGPRATFRAVPTTSGHAVAFARGTLVQPRTSGLEPPAEAEAPAELAAVTVATRLAGVLAARGGWRDHRVVLPDQPLTDLLSGREWPGGATPLAELLADHPVALLVPSNG